MLFREALMKMSGRIAVAALLVCLAPAAARATSCEIPRALLCEGCASAITVTVAPGGGCRIAFTPGGGAGALRLKVLRAAPALRRHYAPVSRRVAPWRPAVGSRCFMAGMRQYCE